LENEEIESSLVVDPTLIAVEIHAGEEIPVELPSFPEAITVAISTDRKVSIIDLRASVSQ